MDVKKWRENMGLSSTQAAAVLGLSQPSVSRIERGEQWPDPETMERLVQASGGAITPDAMHTHYITTRRGHASQGEPAA